MHRDAVLGPHVTAGPGCCVSPQLQEHWAEVVAAPEWVAFLVTATVVVTAAAPSQGDCSVSF